jgi:cytoskeletal protein CcmA (bactofilin family)
MWNRESASPTPGAKEVPQQPMAPQPIPAKSPNLAKPEASNEPTKAALGSSVKIKGTLSGSEDLTVDGQVDGRIDLPGHTLTVGPNARITAEIVAKTVTVFGTVGGNIVAHDTLEIRRGGAVEGEVTCGRIAIQEGAAFSGKVSMGTKSAKPNGATGQPTPVLAAAG